MKRKECEEKLVGLMEEAVKIYRRYNPNGNHLSMFSIDGHMSIYDHNKEGHTIDVTEFPDGTIRHWGVDDEGE